MLVSVRPGGSGFLAARVMCTGMRALPARDGVFERLMSLVVGPLQWYVCRQAEL